MLQRCMNHGFDDFTQIYIFKNGLQQQPKLILDDIIGGSLMLKSVGGAIAIVKRMALSDY